MPDSYADSFTGQCGERMVTCDKPIKRFGFKITKPMNRRTGKYVHDISLGTSCNFSRSPVSEYYCPVKRDGRDNEEGGLRSEEFDARGFSSDEIPQSSLLIPPGRPSAQSPPFPITFLAPT